MDLMQVVLWPIQFFAFNPMLCGLVAAAFTLAALVPNRSRGSRIVLAVVALLWWGFTGLETATPMQTNIRIDLVFLGPVFLGAAVVGLVYLFLGRKRPANPDQTAA